MTIFYDTVYESDFCNTMKERQGWPYSVARQVFNYYENDGDDEFQNFDPIELTQYWTYRSTSEIVEKYSSEYEDENDLYINGQYYQIGYDNDLDIALAICEDHGCFVIGADDDYVVMSNVDGL